MANCSMYQSILCALLDCGSTDLQMLDGANEDFVINAIVALQSQGIDVSLNGIFEEMFMTVQSRMQDILETRIGDLECYKDSDSISDEEAEELEAIKELNPDEDITWYLNWLDTHIYIDGDKEETYWKYFKSELDNFESDTGFCFE